MHSTARLLAALILLLPLGVPAAENVPAADERSEAYTRYRAAFDARDYAGALPLAVRVVELTIAQYGEEGEELAVPLGNLATTLYRMGRHGEAIDQYRRALTLLDRSATTTDPRLVAPLHGLGAALRAQDRCEEAIVPLKRATDIIRNREGLHAPSQLPVVRPLIDCYERTWRIDDANREHQFAYNVAEQAYGAEDPRLIGPLVDYARWHERTGRYSAARLMYMRAVQIADREGPTSLKAVEPLRGIARTYRLAFVNGESQERAMQVAQDLPPSLAQSQLVNLAAVPSGEGERALRNALQRLEIAGDGAAAMRGEVLVDLGDWYRIAGAGQRAVNSWIQAWGELSKAGDTSLLDKPAAIVYRPPSMATSQRPQNPDEYNVVEVQVRVSIAADGSVRDATIANAGERTDSAARPVINAVRRATWRPAFSGGVPVATPDHLFTEHMYVRVKGKGSDSED
jgi:tetratricopeptide (TPR) repeat protein